MYKKIAAVLFATILLASCGAGRTTISNHRTSSSSIQNDVIEYGRKYLGKPYRYAGRGPNSFDCSGFTCFVFKEFGYKLNPSSSGQERQFPTVVQKDELTKGDLVFFEGRRKNGRVGHVGIVTEARPDGTFRFIHASTNYGVIVSSSAEQYYASRYLRGGRVLEADDPSTVQRNRSTDKRSFKYNPYTPATAKNRPSTPVVPATVTLNKAEASVPDNAAGQSELTSDNSDRSVILIQTDPLKNPPLRDIHSADTRNEQNGNPIFRTKRDVILKRDSVDIPEPAVVNVE